jgi:adenine-specific DNA-methyltransferase
MFGVKDGFDVVIGNPPYVRADNPSIAVQRAKILQSGQYITLWEKWDLMVPFFERSLNILRPAGILTFVVSNAITTSKYAEKLQDWIIEKHFVRSIDYFENIKVFEAGVVPVVISLLANHKARYTRKIYRADTFDNANIVTLENSGENLKSKIFRKTFSDTFEPMIPFERLGDVCYLSYGLRPNSDEKTAKGEFARDDLVSDVKDKIHCKEYVEGKDISAYKIDRIRYIEYYTKRVPSQLCRPTFEDLYTDEKILRGILTKGIFDNTGILCNHSIIVFKRFCDLRNVNERSISVSISKNNFEQAGSKTAAQVAKRRAKLEQLSIGYSLKYILAVINSSYAMAYLNNYRRHRLENYFYPDDFRNFPLPKIPPAEQEKFVALVDKILARKAVGEDMVGLEEEIDKMVYAVYGLTEDEVKVVAGKE